METIVAVFAIFFVLGLIYALRHAIAHLILAVGSVAIIWYFLGTPGQNGWWSLIGFFILLGQFLTAKEALIDKPTAERAATAVAKKREDAENYILSSGDPEAIKMLMLARASPQNYNQVLSGGARTGNTTLRTAIGVAAGVAIGNVVSDSIIESALHNNPGGSNAGLIATAGSENESDSDDAGDNNGYDSNNV